MTLVRAQEGPLPNRGVFSTSVSPPRLPARARERTPCSLPNEMWRGPRRAIGDFVKRPQIKPSRAQQGQALRLTRPWWPRVKGYPGSGLSSCSDLGGFPPPTLLTAGILGAGLWLPAGEQFPLPV